MGNNGIYNYTVIGNNSNQKITGSTGRKLNISFFGTDGNEISNTPIDGNNKKVLKLNSKFTLFNAISNLYKEDGENVLSEQDIYLAKNNLDRKKYGIKDIRHDSNAGIVKIVCNDGSQVVFDFESDEEIATQKANEKKFAAANEKIKQANKNHFGKFYDFKTEEDENGEIYIVIKIKEPRWCNTKPNLGTILNDFGVKYEDLFTTSDQAVAFSKPKYGNDVFTKRADHDWENNYTYKAGSLEKDDTIRIPERLVNFSNRPDKEYFWE